MKRLLAAIIAAATTMSAQAATPYEVEYLEASLATWSTQEQSSDTTYDWDRGFDATGAPIWGPDDGGYIFKQVETSQ